MSTFKQAQPLFLTVPKRNQTVTSVPRYGLNHGFYETFHPKYSYCHLQEIRGETLRVYFFIDSTSAFTEVKHVHTHDFMYFILFYFFVNGF